MDYIIDKARQAAIIAHAGQKRRNGEDYFTAHIEPVAKSVEGHRYNVFDSELNNIDYVVAAAYLHDVLEDTDYDLSDFPKEVIGIIEAVTRKPGQNYYDFIMSIYLSPYRREARIVKLADLENNMATLEEGSMKDKYRFAHHVLRKSYEYF